jgi:hypothetical protein
MNATAALDAIGEALERTRAAGSARVALVVEHAWGAAPVAAPRPGPVRRALLGAGKRIAKRVFRDVDLLRQEAEGFLDLAARRYMIDYGSYARLFADGREWGGLSGRELATLPPEHEVVPTPLWLVDVVAGITSAEEVAGEDVRGERCRHFVAETDLSQASRATPGGVAAPTVGRFENLLALPIHVWLDESHVRRVRRASSDRIETVELWDFGAPLAALDWTRLPTFRTPG